MGRLTGIEPASNGATNRRVNHFTTAAVSAMIHIYFTQYQMNCKDINQ